jgi:hypothetical protein
MDKRSARIQILSSLHLYIQYICTKDIKRSKMRLDDVFIERHQIGLKQIRGRTGLDSSSLAISQTLSVTGFSASSTVFLLSS